MTAKPMAWARWLLPVPGGQSHTAQFPRSVTVHYRWHPLVGQTFTVTSCQRTRDGGRGFRCQLADGTWSFLPEWMTSRERCAGMTLVSDPVVAVEALLSLSDLLGALASAPPRIGADATPS